MEPVRRNPLLSAERNALRLLRMKEQLAKAEDKATTGLAVTRPSDAPGAWSPIHRLQQSIADIETWAANATQGATLVDTAEEALASGSDILKMVRERAIQFANETYSTRDRLIGADEIDALKQQLIDVANTHLGDRSVFAGTAYDGAAYDALGNYLGNSDRPEVEIGKDQRVPTGLDGQAVFQGAVDVFATLDALAAAMRADDTTSIRNLLPDVTTAFDSLVSWREELGFHQVRLADAQAADTSLEKLALEEQIGADPASTYAELMGLRTAYEAALQVSGTASGAKLFDFIR